MSNVQNKSCAYNVQIISSVLIHMDAERKIESARHERKSSRARLDRMLAPNEDTHAMLASYLAEMVR